MYHESALQKGTTLISTGTEYFVLSECGRMWKWLSRVLQELGITQERTIIYEDNAGAVEWATGNFAEDFRRIKHVYLRHQYVREQIE